MPGLRGAKGGWSPGPRGSVGPRRAGALLLQNVRWTLGPMLVKVPQSTVTIGKAKIVSHTFYTGACFKISSKTIIPSKCADKCTCEAAAATSSVFGLSLSIKNNAEGTPVLTLICIERDVLEELEFDDVIQEFVKLKLRKKYFDLRPLKTLIAPGSMKA
ncbi:hypothetical protein NQ317_014688 [Molorchus minor]|uniref:Uncharacterized protein n=1 Tax=Molorchus minor TaxID=1323400 RepID=A0ABQ9JK47_9CUCU|nr:hypothetical protein NQ317_014688 [Molorchus minor]